MFFKKKNQLLTSVKKELLKLIKEDFEIKYMIVPRRTLKVSDKFLENELVKQTILNWWDTQDKLLSLNNYVNQKKIDFVYTTSLPDELWVKCFSIEYISDTIWNIWKKIDLKSDILSQIKRRFSVINWLTKVAKWKKNELGLDKELKYIENMINFKTKKFIIKDVFFIIEDNDKQLIYTTKEYLSLRNIRDISYYVRNKKKYDFIVLPDIIFFSWKEIMDEYKSVRVKWLDQIANPFLKTYIINNMTNMDFWDFNITYFYKDEDNPYKINVSTRYQGKYKFLRVKWITDFDLNQLDSDVITIWWKLAWTITVTDLKVGRFSYRCLIIRKNWIYYLNLRKTEWIPYSVEELTEKSWVEVDKYIIPEDNSNKNYFLDSHFKLKHFDIDFPLSYTKQDVDSVFAKLSSATKWTFWICWKTNSWKSTSLKNLLLKYYEYNREVNKENRNLMMIENPIEWFDYHLKQIEVSDEDQEEYKDVLMAIKRADLDLCVVWELRTYEVFGIVNEIANSLPLFSTFHVWTIEAFLSILKYYSDKWDLNFRDVFSNVNTCIVQIPLPIEKWEKKLCLDEDIPKLKEEILIKFRLNRPDDDLVEEETLLKKTLLNFIDTMVKNWYYPLKRYTKQKYELFYEIVTWDMINIYLAKKEESFWNIYKYIWWNNNILFKTLKDFIEGKILFDYVKLDEYWFDAKIKTLEYAIEQIKLWNIQKEEKNNKIIWDSLDIWSDEDMFSETI